MNLTSKPFQGFSKPQTHVIMKFVSEVHKVLLLSISPFEMHVQVSAYGFRDPACVNEGFSGITRGWDAHVVPVRRPTKT